MSVSLNTRVVNSKKKEIQILLLVIDKLVKIEAKFLNLFEFL